MVAVSVATDWVLSADYPSGWSDWSNTSNTDALHGGVFRMTPQPPAPVGGTFTLKCIGCKKVEQRPAAACHDQPICRCGMPMLLKEVKT